MNDEEKVYPYCGGCGYRFYREEPIPPTQEDESAKTRKCSYCPDDEEYERKNPSKPEPYKAEEDWYGGQYE